MGRDSCARAGSGPAAEAGSNNYYEEPRKLREAAGNAPV